MSKRSIKTVIAAVLLGLECLTILLLGILAAKKDSLRYNGWISAPEGLYLTLKEDISFTLYEKNYSYPAGTRFETYRIFPDDGVGCILPQDDDENGGSTDTIGFSDTACFTSDIFEEQDILKRLNDEAALNQKELRQEELSKGIRTAVILCVVWLFVGAALVLVLSMKDYYWLLYVIEAAMLLITVVIFLLAVFYH